MKIIDANTGTIVRVGEPFRNVAGTVTLLDVNESWCSATGWFLINNKVMEVPLTVRYLHPAFMFQKVAFVPS